jgi:hypothetical protein
MNRFVLRSSDKTANSSSTSNFYIDLLDQIELEGVWRLIRVFIPVTASFTMAYNIQVDKYGSVSANTGDTFTFRIPVLNNVSYNSTTYTLYEPTLANQVFIDCTPQTRRPHIIVYDDAGAVVNLSSLDWYFEVEKVNPAMAATLQTYWGITPRDITRSNTGVLEF